MSLAENMPAEEINMINSVTGPVPQKVLWKATMKFDSPHNMFLAPPWQHCADCNCVLQEHNIPTTIICFTVDGPIPATKVTLRCVQCGVNYRYDQYGNKTKGYSSYSEVCPFIRASQLVYIERGYFAHVTAFQ